MAWLMALDHMVMRFLPAVITSFWLFSFRGIFSLLFRIISLAQQNMMQLTSTGRAGVFLGTFLLFVVAKALKTYIHLFQDFISFLLTRQWQFLKFFTLICCVINIVLPMGWIGTLIKFCHSAISTGVILLSREPLPGNGLTLC